MLCWYRREREEQSSLAARVDLVWVQKTHWKFLSRVLKAPSGVTLTQTCLYYYWHFPVQNANKKTKQCKILQTRYVRHANLLEVDLLVGVANGRVTAPRDHPPSPNVTLLSSFLLPFFSSYYTINLKKNKNNKVEKFMYRKYYI